MAANAFDEIRKALESRLNTYATGRSPAIDVAWPNSGYTPTTGTEYLRPTLLPGRSRAATAGSSGQQFHQGIFQVDIFWPANEGSGGALSEADAIIDHFKRGTNLSASGFTVRIDDDVYVLPANVEPDWYQVPVNIGFYAIAPNS